jgi:hypothetical protein
VRNTYRGEGNVIRHLFPLAAASALLTACATQPASLQGRFTEIGQSEATLPESLGQNVRWGGQVVGVRDIANTSCLEVSALRLADSSLRPVEPHVDEPVPAPKRFLACNEKGFGADVAKPGTIVTFTGSVTPPQIVHVQHKRCVDGGTYVNTLHANDDKACVIALATLAVEDVYRWPYRARSKVVDGSFDAPRSDYIR